MYRTGACALSGAALAILWVQGLGIGDERLRALRQAHPALELDHRVGAKDRQAEVGRGHGTGLVLGRAPGEVDGALAGARLLVDPGLANRVRQADELQQASPSRRGAGQDDARDDVFAFHDRWDDTPAQR